MTKTDNTGPQNTNAIECLREVHEILAAIEGLEKATALLTKNEPTSEADEIELVMLTYRKILTRQLRLVTDEGLTICT